MIGITEETIKNWFTYHAPKGDQVIKYEELRDAALAFALVVFRLTPKSVDQLVAIRKIREAVMTANAAIACSDEEA